MKLRLGNETEGDAGFSFRSSLPVTSRRAMLPFIPHARKIKRSLDEFRTGGGGLVSYELVADFGAKEFTVRSTWSTEEDFRAWVGTAAHREAVAALRSRVGEGTFETEVLQR